jgi:hypothetical protein
LRVFHLFKDEDGEAAKAKLRGDKEAYRSSAGDDDVIDHEYLR